MRLFYISLGVQNRILRLLQTSVVGCSGRLSILLFIIFEHLVIMFRCTWRCTKRTIFHSITTTHGTQYLHARAAWTQGHLSTWSSKKARFVCVSLCLNVCGHVCMCLNVCGHVCMCLNVCGHVFSLCLGMCVVCACLLIY